MQSAPGFRHFLTANAPWLATGAMLTFLSSFGQTFFISVFAGGIRERFGLGHGDWGGIYFAGTALSALTMIWAGMLTDRFRVRALAPLVLGGLALACIAMATISTVWLLPVVIFALRFFGQGMTSQTSTVAMARWFVATRGRALSIAMLGFSVGEALLPLLFVALMQLTDWQNLWFLAAAMALAAIPLLMLMLRHERTPQSLSAGHSRAGMDSRHWQRREVLRHPLFWFMVPALLGPAAWGTALFFHQVHMANVKGLPHVELVALFPIYTVTAVGAMIGAGWLLDRKGTQRLMPWIQLPMIAAFTIFSLAQGSGAAALGFVAFGLAVGASYTVVPAFWAEFYGTAHIGAIKSMASAVMVLGTALGPVITGYLIDFGVPLEHQFLAIATYFGLTTLSMAVGIGRARQALPDLHPA
ncbi:MFS transporter [Chachezhania antarctica]|uniref:MFS transporter n=1 Tax=Chachezhania antarctica TaxID=2340860 RepID=UPI000EB12EFA|nr:MFS transporter [Chachezhania antarctica]|tara:strand:+ start:4441 stop:5682 length:1242 start_codon:yes stop_codon:yes gene_type:complete